MESLARFAGFSRRQYRQARLLLFLIVIAYFIDVILHHSSSSITKPDSPLDLPFATQCVLRDQELLSTTLNDGTGPVDLLNQRENATIMMLARNSDLKGALSAIRSLEEQWNKWYQYPIVFLNDKEWDPSFIKAMRSASKSELTFEQIPTEMWSWPKNPDGSDAVDRNEAETSWQKMKAAGLPYVAQENYHHMCRFFSGFFYDHPAVAKYRYYWRVEPDVEFTCRIPYDPFSAMKRNNKIYGYTMALWEIGSTCPSLFRTTADFKEENQIPTTSLWNSMLSSNWAPLPVRWFFMSLTSLFHSRTRHGDGWNHCHFWSNFEIADLNFFRSDEYRSYFAKLDSAGGFFTERWGDAPVHSLALSLFAKPEQLHYFEDIGYRHPPFQNCPPQGVGCDCTCDPTDGSVPTDCLNQLRKGVEP